MNSEYYSHALDCFNKTISINKNHYSAYTNLGVIYFKYIINIDLAINFFLKSLSINSTNPIALYNLGCCYEEKNMIKKSIFYFSQTLKIQPNHYRARYNLSLKQLMLCDYNNGWVNFEVRKKILSIKEELLGITNDKVWNGTDTNINLIVHSEQGIGDEILISSLFNDLKKIIKNLTISCDKRLIGIFEKNFRNIIFVDKDTFINKDLDAKHIFSFSLGLYLRKNLSDFRQNKSRWINTNVIADQKIELLIKKTKKLKVGISWKSVQDDKKNISLLSLYKNLPLNKFEILNLQYGDIEKEINILENLKSEKIIFFKDIDYKNDFESLCSIIKKCDFIITTSNVTAHFAGALGKITYLLLPTNHLWYWGNKKNTIWYPKIKIYRQSLENGWKDPLQKINNEIIKKYNSYFLELDE